MPGRHIISLLVLLCAAAFTGHASAEDESRLSPLSRLDQQFLQQQRGRIDEIARSDLGRQLNANKNNNLGILQTILDRRLIKKDQTLELQAMGVVLGDELAREYDLKWVVIEDRYGRSRALQLEETENLLFPITMISRRVEAGSRVKVEQVYEKAAAIIRPLKNPLPFQ